MSRVRRFIGSFDPPTEGSGVVIGFAFGTNECTPEMGFITIPLAAFSQKDLQFMREHNGAQIEGRACPRSIRAWVTG